MDSARLQHLSHFHSDQATAHDNGIAYAWYVSIQQFQIIQAIEALNAIKVLTRSMAAVASGEVETKASTLDTGQDLRRGHC